MFAGFAYGQSYYAGRQLPAIFVFLVVEIATVHSMSAQRTVTGTLDYRAASLSASRTVESLELVGVQSLSPARTVRGIP